MIRRYKHMEICMKKRNMENLHWRYEAQKNVERFEGKQRGDTKLRIDLGKVQGRTTQRETERGRGDGISKQRSRIDAVWEKILGCPQLNEGGVDTV